MRPVYALILCGVALTLLRLYVDYRAAENRHAEIVASLQNAAISFAEDTRPMFPRWAIDAINAVCPTFKLGPQITTKLDWLVIQSRQDLATACQVVPAGHVVHLTFAVPCSTPYVNSDGLSDCVQEEFLSSREVEHAVNLIRPEQVEFMSPKFRHGELVATGTFELSAYAAQGIGLK